MAYQDRPDADHGIGASVSEITERATLLIREEIELAKAEVVEKVTKLVKGSVVAVAAGVFALFGLLFLLHGLSWLLASAFGFAFWGFAVIAAILFLLGAGAGFLALRWLRSGAPPTPDMAIDEAHRIRATLTGEPGGQLEAVAARAQAGMSPEQLRPPAAGDS